MKSSDWALIVTTMAVVGLISYFVVGAVLPNPVDNPETVPIAAEIRTEIQEPSSRIFSTEEPINAYNPAVRTRSNEQVDPFFRIITAEPNPEDPNPEE